MSNSSFQFRQFTIAHDRCAMKVGTDGVLVGAWAELPDTGRVLDVGTGSGLIALMVAQRAPAVDVTAIDIDSSSVEQARENVAASSFATRIEVRRQSLQELATGDESFNAIVCNPPFFEENLLPPDAARSKARHATALTFEELIAATVRLLSNDGSFSVILPVNAFEGFRRLCFAAGLCIKRSRLVQGTAKKAPKRILATFSKGDAEWVQEKPLVLNERDGRSEDYAALTSDFYLW